jgi:hypothetical protein
MDVQDAMVPDDGLDEKGAPYLPREVSRRDATTAAEGAAIVVVVVVVALGPEVRCVPKDAMSSLAVSAALLSLQHRSFLLKGRGSGGGGGGSGGAPFDVVEGGIICYTLVPRRRGPC